MKFMKKAIEVEAFRFDGDFMNSDGHYYVPDWAIKALDEKTIFFGTFEGEPSVLFVKDERQNHYVCVGDYIVRDSDGKISSCKPHVFEATYEQI